MEFPEELHEYVPFALAPSYRSTTEIHYTCRSGNSKDFMYAMTLFGILTLSLFLGVVMFGFWGTIGSGRYGSIPIGPVFLGQLGLVAFFIWKRFKDQRKKHVRINLVSKHIDFFRDRVLLEEPVLGTVSLSKIQLIDAKKKSGKVVYSVFVSGVDHLMVLGAFLTHDAADQFLQIVLNETKLPFLEESSIEIPDTIGFVRLVANDQKAIAKRISV